MEQRIVKLREPSQGVCTKFEDDVEDQDGRIVKGSFPEAKKENMKLRMLDSCRQKIVFGGFNNSSVDIQVPMRQIS